MKSKSLTYFLCSLLLPVCLFAQGGMWTWLKGNDSINVVNYGTQGVADSSNCPPRLYEALQWTDLNGNFWLLGGQQGYFESGDLWEYQPATNNWTWMKGSGQMANDGVYGTMGIADAANYPSSRAYGAATWVDKNGNFWLYGGARDTLEPISGMIYGGSLSDMWKYSVDSNTWTWIAGNTVWDNPPVYGTQGIPSPNNTPGALSECNGAWVDSANNLWFYGGSGQTNALWRYSIDSNEWTWVKGSSTQNIGYYGIKGLPNTANEPDGYLSGSSWTDAQGKFWMFGGSDISATVQYNDMWKFDVSTNNWVWIAGPDTFDNYGNYGPVCAQSPNYLPRARTLCQAQAKDKCGNFLLYGGSDDADLPWIYSDLWQFNPVTLNWTLLNGNADTVLAPRYGTMGIAASGNTPGGRAGAAAWCDNNGVFYIFGGTLSPWPNPTNTLLKFVADSSCTVSALCNAPCTVSPFSLYANRITICTNDSTAVFAPPGFSSYNWNTGETSRQIWADTPGNYYVTVVDTAGCTGISALYVSQSLAAAVLIPTQDSCRYNDGAATAIAVNGAVPYNYSWSTGDTGITIAGLDTGWYRVTVTDAAGCTATASTLISTSIDTFPWNDYTSATICPGDTYVLCAEIFADTYLWNTGATTSCININVPGLYSLYAASEGCLYQSAPFTVDTFATPADTITIMGDTLGCAGYVLHWFLNGAIIDTATNQTLVTAEPGSYMAEIQYGHQCITYTPALLISPNSIALINPGDINVFPNPSLTGKWTLLANENMAGEKLEIYDTYGNVVYQSFIQSTPYEIALNAAGGVYMLQIITPAGTLTRKLIRL